VWRPPRSLIAELAYGTQLKTSVEAARLGLLPVLETGGGTDQRKVFWSWESSQYVGELSRVLNDADLERSGPVAQG
jgi:hypothetical protein